MIPMGEGKAANEIQEESREIGSPGLFIGQNDFPLYSSTSQRGLLDEKKHGHRFWGAIKGFPKAMKSEPASRLPSTSKFWKIADGGQDISSSAPPSDHGSRKHSFIPFVRKINWASLWEMAKQWIRDPLNMALFLWIVCVAVSGAILFLVMTGMLNGAIPEKSKRDTWFEVNNQILNALFTLMCLYQHPKRFHHLAMLCRWRPNDILSLRKLYCKNGTEKPNEWKHMMVVVVLLHINCFAQYALCGLNIGYPRSRRPAIGVGLCISVAFAAPAIASVYNILSPLGKDYETEMDQESQCQVTSDLHSLEKKYSFMSREDGRSPVRTPEWIGGLFNFWDDISLAYMSVFCSCCVFGWNMDRLGFGNMYVHIVTFLLFCLAPFFIFNLAAINIDNENVREALGISGFLLCIFGLLYGGFWRIQMRKRFSLPGNNFCCGKPAVTDCFQWLCCCWCSLAQEVRTADYYEVIDDKFYSKQTSNGYQHPLSPLPREDGSMMFNPSPSISYWNGADPSSPGMQYSASPSRVPGGQRPAMAEAMKPPSTPVIQRGDDPAL